MAYVAVPRLYQEYTATHVLVMEYIDGFSLDDREGLLAQGYDLKEIGTKLVDHYIKAGEGRRILPCGSPYWKYTDSGWEDRVD